VAAFTPPPARSVNNSIKDPVAGRVALLHLVFNAGLVLLFSVNAWVRIALSAHSVIPLIFSIVGIAGLVVSGWLGGELVYVHKVGVPARGSLAAEIKRGKRTA
jgi:uncharacterized membrane protein